MSPDLEKLIALHEIDQKLIEYQVQIDNLIREAEQIETDYQQIASAFHSTEDDLSAARKRCRELEQELADAQTHHEKYKEDLKKTRNQKQYETALREIDSTAKIISQLEKQILEAMGEVEGLEAELGKFSPDIENKRQAADEAIAQCRMKKAHLEQDLERIRQEHIQLEASVTKPWLDRYHRVAKLRAGQALSEVINGACSACRMTLRPQVFSEVRQGDIIYICDHCSRILFYRPEVKAEAFEA